MTTTRALRDEIINILSRLSNIGLIAYYNQISMDKRRVSWTGSVEGQPFLITHGEPTIQLYRHWVENNAYLAQLLDGALLQISYDVEGGVVAGHRLAYVPSPYKFDPEMVRSGEPLVDLLDTYVEIDPLQIVLHSTIRFDYDPDNAAPGHPSAHMTLNTPECRIACSAPMHVGRFFDFVFRNFYRSHWLENREYFSSLAKNIGAKVITDDEIASPHLHWV